MKIKKPLNSFGLVIIFRIATTDKLLMIFKGQMLQVRIVIIFSFAELNLQFALQY